MNYDIQQFNRAIEAARERDPSIYLLQALLDNAFSQQFIREYLELLDCSSEVELSETLTIALSNLKCEYQAIAKRYHNLKIIPHSIY